MRDLVQRYYALDEAIATDPGVPLNRYYEVAGGSYARNLLHGAQAQRAKGYRVIGRVKVGRPSIRKLDLSPSRGSLPSAQVTVCLDVRHVQVVDKNGKSVVAAGRADAYVEKLILRKESFGWRAVDGANTETSQCER